MGLTETIGGDSAETDALQEWGACISHTTPACSDLVARLREDCPFPKDPKTGARPCVRMIAQLEERLAQAKCSQGSVSECEAACSAHGPWECLELARIYHRGSRVERDDAKAERLVAGSCEAGIADACNEQGVWLRGIDDRRAAASFMQGCASDAAGANVSCALWFEDVDQHRYAPPPGELVAGLTHVCDHEKNGDLPPGTLLLTGQIKVRYEGGACGRLKDLGPP